jgi:hypothetical protein
MKTAFYVRCAECQEQHYVDEVELLNVEEDIIGRDIMYFVCPETAMYSKSLVYKE